MKYVKKVFAERLKEVRKAAGLSQGKLAEELGVSRGAISYYEAGERVPDIEFLDAFSTYFNLPLDFALGQTKNLKAENRNMYEFYGLTDEACEQLDFSRGDLGKYISEILGHRNFSILKITYQKLINNYKSFDYGQLNYISFLISRILQGIIADSLQTLMGSQFTSEEKNAMQIEDETLSKNIDALQKQLENLTQKAHDEFEMEKNKIPEDHSLQISSRKRVHDKFADIIGLAES